MVKQFYELCAKNVAFHNAAYAVDGFPVYTDKFMRSLHNFMVRLHTHGTASGIDVKKRSNKNKKTFKKRKKRDKIKHNKNVTSS